MYINLAFIQKAPKVLHILLIYINIYIYENVKYFIQKDIFFI